MKEQDEGGVLHGSGLMLNSHFMKNNWLPFMGKKTLARSSLPIFFLVVLCVGAYVSTRLLDSSLSIFAVNSQGSSIWTAISSQNFSREIPKLPKRDEIEIPLNCSLGDATRTCPANYYPSKFLVENPRPSSTSQPTCPDYFRWIHEDLSPWRETGIAREMVEMAKPTASFRLVILNGTAYVETYKKCYQTRDNFTVWGILQLLRRYPGQVPDLEMMFNCDDFPVIKKEESQSAPPPLFHYCGDDKTLDIVFPDWSFWGWPEINIKPWGPLWEDLKRGSEKTKWVEREPYAYWKGNPVVAETRMDLLKCNVTEQQEWNARVYAQDWIQEEKEGYKQSNLADQCIHRFKIYIEGFAWSVSEKYILTCDSISLLVSPHYYDFFSRSLMPLKHYWPIRDDDKCRSIKYAVDWGNSHEKEARTLGQAASSFIQEELRMNYVYDYMLHLLCAYAKLLKYKPTVPQAAVELCSESMACPAQGLEKQFMMDSAVKGPNLESPCVMPPPYDPATLHSILEKKDNGIKQVETWEKQYWDGHSKQT